MSSRSFATAQAPAKQQAAPPVAAGFAQRQCSCGQHVTGGGKCAECKRKADLQRKKGEHAQDPGDMDVLSETVPQTQGQPISGLTRAFMETRFQHDFSQVRVHTGSTAAESAQAVNALAYTVGRDIVFGADQYAPHTARGALLLAHELTHVAQQSNAALSPSLLSKSISDPGDAAEREADTVANQVVSGNHQQPVAVRQSPNAALHAVDQGVGIGIGIGIGVAGIGALTIAGLAGGFDKAEFSDQELTNYLAVLDTGRIEGHTDSDNKARALVKRWVTGTSSFLLSPVRKMFMIREMQDGFVSDDDREGILTLLENSPDMGLVETLSPPLNFPALLSDLNSGAFADRTILFFVKRMSLHNDPLLAQFASWYTKENFDTGQHAMAQKILLDVLAVPNLDFADGGEFKNEISKRLRISTLMQESQANSNGFGYPESIKSNNVNDENGCADYQAPPKGSMYNPANARVNKAARDYWSSVVTTNGAANPSESNLSYYFDLSPKGRENAYEALTTLFTPQESICDKTLIHCDYLVNVIQFRTYAETIGIDKFNEYVKGGRILMRLTYTGFSDPYRTQDRPSPKGLGYSQNTRPQSPADLMIGDHVTFWNHLAFDGLNEIAGSPWRLENAVLVDKDAKGEDLFQGHGSRAPRNENAMLAELAEAFNDLAKPALDAAEEMKAGRLQQSEFVKQYGHQVRWKDGRWVVIDPGRESFRNGWVYDLRPIDETHPEADPWLPGLKDPMNLNQMNVVDRPIESAPGKAPTP